MVQTQTYSGLRGGFWLQRSNAKQWNEACWRQELPEQLASPRCRLTGKVWTWLSHMHRKEYLTHGGEKICTTDSSVFWRRMGVRLLSWSGPQKLSGYGVSQMFMSGSIQGRAKNDSIEWIYVSTAILEDKYFTSKVPCWSLLVLYKMRHSVAIGKELTRIKTCLKVKLCAHATTAM